LMTDSCIWRIYYCCDSCIWCRFSHDRNPQVSPPCNGLCPCSGFFFTFYLTFLRFALLTIASPFPALLRELQMLHNLMDPNPRLSITSELSWEVVWASQHYSSLGCITPKPWPWPRLMMKRDDEGPELLKKKCVLCQQVAGQRSFRGIRPFSISDRMSGLTQAIFSEASGPTNCGFFHLYFVCS
jgi:hypothetical protein